MVGTIGLLRVAEFARLPQPPGGVRQELHHGKLVEIVPVKKRHTKTQMRLLQLLSEAANPMAPRVDKEFPVRPLPEHEVWIADVAVFSPAEWERTDDDDYFQGVPAIVTEVLSPSNTPSEILDREQMCLANGWHDFWLVDAERQTVKVVLADRRSRVYRDSNSIASDRLRTPSPPPTSSHSKMERMLHRRHFFVGALATAPFASPTRLTAAQNSALGVAMIGVGNRGGHVMKNGVMLTQGMRVAAICDTNGDRLDKAASVAARDNPFTTRDWREAITRRDVDAVHISTPCHLHVEMAIAALRAGKHVYCEKPVGITPSSIAELVHVARGTDRVVQVGQQLRSNKRLRETVQRVHDGVAGKVVMIKAQRHLGDDLAHDATSAEWFFDASKSGDVLVEMSVHNLDVCNWVVQDRPEMASGFGGTMIWQNDPPGRTNMDGYTLSYEYRNGVKLSYTQVFFHPNGMPANGQFWNLYSANGGVDLMNSVYYPRAKGSSPQPLAPEGARENLDQQHVQSFLDAIKGGGKPNADLSVGVSGAMTAILGREAIYRRATLRWADLGVLL